MERRNFIKTTASGLAGIGILPGMFSCRQVEESFIDRLLPAPVGGGYSMEDYWIWGSSVIRGEDGRYHMFADRWSKKLGFGNWVTNSEVVRAVADTPVGPYTFEEVVLPVRGKDYFDGLVTHNPRIIKYQDYYLLYYFGTTYDFQIPEDENIPDWNAAWMNKRIGLAISKSVYGPWKRLDKPVIEPRRGKWDATITTNPAPVVIPETGEILLMYKSSEVGPVPPLLLGVAKAQKPEGPYERLSDDPIFRFEKAARQDNDVEDPYVWRANGRFEVIMKDRFGHIGGEEGGGLRAWSNDGVKWNLYNQPKAYSRSIRWNDGTTTVQNHFERPFLLIENGVPTHLFAATGNGSKAWQIEHSWNMVIPLRT
ncbi:MAG: glycoside hydrolase family protein [Mariniphaga sp.]|jgi:hypothetical protein